MASKALIERTFKVTAPLVYLKVATPDGVAVRGFYAGAYVTGCTDAENVRHHLDNSLVEELDKAPEGAAVVGPDTPVQPQTGEQPPAGEEAKSAAAPKAPAAKAKAS